jgi:hypothetical protein
MRKSILFLLLSAAWLASCGDSDIDVMPPTMEFISLNPEPVEEMICGTLEDTVFLLRNGETLDFSVVFRDDAALSQYKVDIHNNFDCHGHGGASAPSVSQPNVDQLTEDWTLLEINNLNGTEAPVSRSLAVPGNVTAGSYHFQIQVIDEAGNDNPLANFYSLKVLNNRDEEKPVITATIPAGDFSAAKGTSILFEGEVTDNFSLSQGGNGLLFLTYTDLSSGNTFTTNAVSVFDETVDKNFSFSFNYTVPNTLKAGSYLFTLRAHDGVRNVAQPVQFNVEVTN